MEREFLIVDDAPAVRKTMEQMLIREGVDPDRVRTAERGKEAMALASEAGPDVVFLDVAMPDVDGDEVGASIWADRPDTRIVVVTGMLPDDERVVDLRCSGAFEILEKPVRRHEVEHVLDLLDTESAAAGRIH